MTSQFVNTAGYRFINLPDREQLRQPFKDVCQELGLLGTILLSTEGINFFLSGSQEAVDGFTEYIENDQRFAGMSQKISYSTECAFRKMNVRLKKEIISMGVDEVKPAEFTGEHITPSEFKQWLDEGREITILDTRNDYEIRLGTFQDSVNFDIASFRAFPQAVKQSTLDKEKPIVMFCTGGVRCEKASAVMLDEGFKDVRQLQGGILGYFEAQGGAYWDGECFVFDRRVAVDSQLKETKTEVCFACREPLTVCEQENEDYVLGVSCSYCVRR